MKVSTRLRYGARALVEVAGAYPDGMLSVRDVAERQGISAKYLEHIMGSLRAAGLVKAARGMHGGYCLTRPPADITLREVFEALEGSVAPVDCVDHPESCPQEELCAIRRTWIEVKNSMARVLEGTTIQDLVERKQTKGAPPSAMYDI